MADLHPRGRGLAIDADLASSAIIAATQLGVAFATSSSIPPGNRTATMEAGSVESTIA